MSEGKVQITAIRISGHPDALKWIDYFNSVGYSKTCECCLGQGYHVIGLELPGGTLFELTPCHECNGHGRIDWVCNN
jgi:hypothetical protein